MIAELSGAVCLMSTPVRCGQGQIAGQVRRLGPRGRREESTRLVFEARLDEMQRRVHEPVAVIMEKDNKLTGAEQSGKD